MDLYNLTADQLKALRAAARGGNVHAKLGLAFHASRGIRLSAEDVGTLLTGDDAMETAILSIAEETAHIADASKMVSPDPEVTK